MKHQPRVKRQLFAETRMGIVTRYGDWFHITSEQIEKFVPGLLEKMDLEPLVRGAQAWVKSADSLAMILALVLLVTVHPALAAVLTVLFHLGWYVNKSSFVIISLNAIVDFLYKDGTQLLLSLVVLGYLGFVGHYLAMGIGLVFFFILKLGLLRKVWDQLYRRFIDPSLTLNDRVMKMVILRYAIYEDVAPQQIRAMEDRIKDLATSRKKNH